MFRNILQNWFGSSATDSPERALVETLEDRALLSASVELAAAPVAANAATVVTVKALPNVKGTWAGFWTVGRQSGKITAKIVTQNGSALAGSVTVLNHTYAIKAKLNSNGTFSFSFKGSVVSASGSGKVVGKVITGKFSGSSSIYGSGSGTFKLTKR